MNKDLSRYRIYGKFTILQFMSIVGCAALVAVMLLK